MKRLTSEQLLSLVECLATDEVLPEKRTQADKMLAAIYKFVHSHREDACCKAVHEDWRQESINAYDELKKLGEL